MKRVTILFVLVCLSIVKAAAVPTNYEWTDESGIKWTFEQNSYNINNVYQYYWTITGASNYGDEVTVPDMVFITTSAGMEAHNVEAVSLSLDASTVVLPSNLKIISSLFFHEIRERMFYP